MTALLERTQTRMARSWTTQEVLEGWARHYEAMLDGRLSPVCLPTGKQPRYHKSSGASIDLDFGAWTRVEGLGYRDFEIRAGLRGIGPVCDALAADLARCPYPCEAPSNDPPMPSPVSQAVVRPATKARNERRRRQIAEERARKSI